MLNFFHFFASTILESIPFLLLGATLSAVMEKWIPGDWFVRHAPSRAWISGLLGLFLGCILPTCECGSILIVRKLIAKKAPVPFALNYMLAGVVINPIVILSTWTAFPGKPQIVIFRLLISMTTALVTTFIISRCVPATAIFPKRQRIELQLPCCAAKDSFASTVLHEFFSIFALLSLGVFLSGLARVFMPDAAWLFLRDHSVLAIPLLEIYAFILSICSETDAFIAASFVGLPSGAILAFLCLGPVLDLKLLLLYRATFSMRVLRILLIVPPLTVWILCSAVEMWL